MCFSYKYLKGNRKAVDNKNIFRKINEDEYIFLTQFNQKNNVGTNFTLENFKGEKLNFKISSTSIRYIPDIEKFRLNNYTKRTMTDSIDLLESRRTFDTIFSFNVDDLIPASSPLCSLIRLDLNFFESDHLRYILLNISAQS